MADVMHTPGPWKVIVEAESPRVVLAAHGEPLPDGFRYAPVIVCRVGVGHNRPLAEAMANGRLIAVAPDLLAACERAVAAYDAASAAGRSTWSGADVDAMKAAIFKAAEKAVAT